MTNDEATMIVAMIETNWQPFKSTKPAIELWASVFEHDPYELVKTAVMMLIQTDPSEFRPTVAKVRRKMRDIVYGNRITETEAWLIVKNSLHEAQDSPETLKGAKSAWKKLPEDIQKLVTPRELYEWNSVPYETLDTVIQSNFMRSYRDVANRRYEKETISLSVLEDVKKLQAASPVFRDPDDTPKLTLPKPETPKPQSCNGLTPDQVVGFEMPDYMRSTVSRWIAEGKMTRDEIRYKALHWEHTFSLQDGEPDPFDDLVVPMLDDELL